MASEPDVPAEGGRPAAALAGPFLHQRAALRSPRPGGRIDELDAPEKAGDDPDDTTLDHSEEDDAR
jgi:hypothetical protein